MFSKNIPIFKFWPNNLIATNIAKLETKLLKNKFIVSLLKDIKFLFFKYKYSIIALNHDEIVVATANPT